jgi:hypothetical protein
VVDFTGKRWLVNQYVSSGGSGNYRIRMQVSDTAYDASSVDSFYNTGESMPFPVLWGYGLGISEDGTKILTLGQDNARTFSQYSLAVPFSLETAKLSSVSIMMTSFGNANDFYSFAVAPDGYRILFVGGNKVNAFDLAVPWDIGTMRFIGSFTAPYAGISSVCVNKGATKLYLSGSQPSYSIHQFSLTE